jgi:hypothetical protein
MVSLGGQVLGSSDIARIGLVSSHRSCCVCVSLSVQGNTGVGTHCDSAGCLCFSLLD